MELFLVQQYTQVVLSIRAQKRIIYYKEIEICPKRWQLDNFILYVFAN